MAWANASPSSRGQRERDVPGVRERPIRAAPERLDPDPVAAGDELAGQPPRGSSLRVGSWTAIVERRERGDGLDRAHRGR